MAMLSKIPAISTAQMIEVDRLMTDVYQIELVQMMENAGRHLAALARSRFLDNNPIKKTILVLAGNGGNGGGGFVAARRLHSWGAIVHVFLAREENDFRGIPRHQLEILRRMGVMIIEPTDHLGNLPNADLLLDALIGYSLTGNPHGHAKQLIKLANSHSAPILSLDVPSGIDATRGKAFHPHITATATLTLALPKTGLISKDSISHVGELFLADISVPPELYSNIGLNIGPIFSQEEILKIA